MEFNEATTEFDYLSTNHQLGATVTTPNTTLAAANSPHRATISVRIDNVYMNALFDSGSTSSFLHPDELNWLWPFTLHTIILLWLSLLSLKLLVIVLLT